MENLSWLFYAYGAGWALIFLDLWWISGRERALRRRIAALEKLLDRRAPGASA